MFTTHWTFHLIAIIIKHIVHRQYQRQGCTFPFSFSLVRYLQYPFQWCQHMHHQSDVVLRIILSDSNNSRQTGYSNNDLLAVRLPFNGQIRKIIITPQCSGSRRCSLRQAGHHTLRCEFHPKHISLKSVISQPLKQTELRVTFDPSRFEQGSNGRPQAHSTHPAYSQTSILFSWLIGTFHNQNIHRREQQQ